MTNWSYKTVHFELKKEGLLGASFLDESEIERELNEYGRRGWEMVAVIEVHNGVIVFFKQALPSPGSARLQTIAADAGDPGAAFWRENAAAGRNEPGEADDDIPRAPAGLESSIDAYPGEGPEGGTEEEPNDQQEHPAEPETGSDEGGPEERPAERNAIGAIRIE